MPERGRLRVYLGAAPGVGKTFAMLGEGNRRRERGTDVVVGFVETHGRAKTEAAIGDLEVLPRTFRSYRGGEFSELDVDAVLERRPKVVLIDELAHTNIPGGRHEKRWQDIDDILDVGIDVITTVNIQHLESINDVVEKITGVPQREKVPDSVVRAADQIELVDMTPEALRRRMSHGNIYAADKVDAALAHYFRVGNLTALRELALLWLAERVDEGLQRYREEHHIAPVWEARERVVVALTGGPEGETLIRRAARIAARSSRGDLLAVHVIRSDGLTGASPAALADQRRLVESLGGSFHSVVGDDIPMALLEFARAEHATQLVLGTSRRGTLATLFGGAGIGQTTTRLSGDIDVHMVTHEHAGKGRRLPSLTGGLTVRRRLAGAAVALVGVPLLTLVLTAVPAGLNLTSEILLYLLAVIGVALVGGFYPALLAAIIGTVLLNYYFTPPIHTFTISELNNVVALVIFVAAAAMVSSVVDLAARRTRIAARASAEAETLSVLAGSVLRGEQALPALVERLRETFGMTSVTLLSRSDASNSLNAAHDARLWTVVATAGTQPCLVPADADIEMPVGDDAMLALRGRPLPASDRRVLGAFAAQAAVALEQRRLAREAQQARPLAETDRMRTALLNAVSHDLRSPLASARVAVESLLSSDVAWTEEERDELLATAHESLDKLSRLVENLLDMSRLESGALSTLVQPIALDEVIPRALDDLGAAGADVEIRDVEYVPQVSADAALLERVIVNLVANALRYNPAALGPVIITASVLDDQVELRIIDRGPGISEDDRERVFRPFQRLGDRDNTTGVGLGLALSRGLVEAMHGTLDAEDTPGGGLTMVVTLRAASVRVEGTAR